MKTTPADLAAAAALALKKRASQKDESRQWHPSVLEFEDGVDVSEVVDTMPGELWDLFHPSQTDPS
jgi:hypothetical protein